MICKHCNKQFKGKSFCTKYRVTYCEEGNCLICEHATRLLPLCQVQCGLHNIAVETKYKCDDYKDNGLCVFAKANEEKEGE